jgi:CxxC-x17-CxxC domain-containing protein
VHQDKTITCIDCGADFTFTADEQEFYSTHQLTNEPKRCKPCREKKKSMPRNSARRTGAGAGYSGNDAGQAPGQGTPRGGPGPRNEGRPRFKIVCHACGKEDEVPFQPREGREVYCRDCYSSRRG